MLEKGYIQIYTGNGKGKTTASLGVCLRALASGFKVLYVQFIKSGSSSEFELLEKFPDFHYRSFGKGRFIVGRGPSDDEKDMAMKGLEETGKAVSSGDYDIVILDEACPAIKAGLFPESKLIELLQNKNGSTEIIITGRGASQKLIEKADLVTEMKEIRHYWSQGVTARKGIEK